MAHYNFEKDCVLGLHGEDIVVDKLLSNFPDLSLVESRNTDNRYDVILRSLKSKKDYLIEIKTDFYCTPDYDTGNMFIEYSCRNKPSGISVTMSDMFVMHYIHLQEFWLIPTDRLKYLLLEYSSSFRKTKSSGDDNSLTCGYLIPRHAYKNHFTILV